MPLLPLLCCSKNVKCPQEMESCLSLADSLPSYSQHFPHPPILLLFNLEIEVNYSNHQVVFEVPHSFYWLNYWYPLPVLKGLQCENILYIYCLCMNPETLNVEIHRSLSIFDRSVDLSFKRWTSMKYWCVWQFWWFFLHQGFYLRLKPELSCPRPKTNWKGRETLRDRLVKVSAPTCVKEWQAKAWETRKWNCLQ